MDAEIGGKKDNEKAVSLDNSSRWISRLHCRGGGRITSIQSWQRVCRAVLARCWHDPDVRCIQFESVDATAGLMRAVVDPDLVAYPGFVTKSGGCVSITACSALSLHVLIAVL